MSSRLRVLSFVAAAGCLVLGLGLQLLERSIAADVAGSVLYVCAVGMMLGALRPAMSSAVVASLSLAFAVAVELLQLTGAPQAIVAVVPPLRLLFGSSFDPLDLVAYAIGAVILFVARLGLVRIAARPRARPRPHPATDR